MKNNKKIMIIYYSMHGHTYTLAKEILKGITQVEGIIGELWRVPETLSEDVLKKMNVRHQDEEVPILTFDKMEEMTTADGFLFGMPTRYGMMPAQMKAMWDATGQYWVNGQFVGKPAGFFFSTSTLGGGQETTAFTAITQLAHHGMVYVPLGYTYGAQLFDLEGVRGGSSYGAGTFAGPDNKRNPSDLELNIARHQGDYFAKFVKRLNL